ncbi:MAG: endonuclease [Planctomycetota bacterium]
MEHADLDPTTRALLARYGRTYACELGIRIEKNTPAPLFQLLCAALLYSARIQAPSATRAMKALLAAGLTTAQRVVDASWQERVDLISAHGYRRYDERTATQLGQAGQLVQERYGGDLRRLREEAGRAPGRERELLQEVKGIGPVGADIFLREAQIAWDELYPFADARALAAAGRLGLGDTPAALAARVPEADFARLAAALVRVDLADDYAAVRAVAAAARRGEAQL